MKNVQRIIFMVAIIVLILSHIMEVEASRPLKHPFTPTTVKTLKVARAYSGPSRSGVGHNIIY
ncbi:hypothetical protein ERO13_A06G022300v2 [Gossypium hirsutum]|uniref:Uncharacterized protein n=2 Tax=Gossypium TaxID=3633 RepID=A0A5J5V977_GOSBA|nr:hypothetical protein ES319_A06G024600v1 [Gossypium barbadense]KAG4193904.1 hypothetical protein ERO13_A06G022300v2 [Gossypium hirsutum]TYI21248.1 hypothetical protein ES332_A06G024800v1 [Gossypium tomentosum]